jgi:ribosomal protein L7/L12
MTDPDVILLHAKVAKLERTVAFLLEKLNLSYEDNLAVGVSAAVMNLIKQGNTLGAIQEYRKETGAGLAEAKQVVEALLK